MRKILLSLALCLCFSAMHAYFPMLKQGYSWTYANHGSRGLKYYQYYLDADTVMNGCQYYRLKSISKDFYYADKYMLRENVDEQKVYVYAIEEACEYLLYDFSLTVGDSVQVFVPNKCSAKDRYQLSWIYIVKVDTVVDLFGDTLKIFSYNTLSEVLPPNEEKHWRGGRYLERYGAVTGFLATYNEVISYYVAGYSTPYQVCGFDENGMLGNRNGGDRYDCTYKQVKPKQSTSSDIEEPDSTQQTASPQAEEIETETLPEENPSKEEDETPEEKKPLKSKNLKRCTMELEKSYSKKQTSLHSISPNQ